MAGNEQASKRSLLQKHAQEASMIHMTR